MTNIRNYTIEELAAVWEMLDSHTLEEAAAIRTALPHDLRHALYTYDEMRAEMLED